MRPRTVESATSVPRLFVIGSAIALLHVVILARAFYLQIVEGSHYETVSASNAEQARMIRPTRGVIVDCRGRVLATNRASFDITFLPRGVAREDYERVARRVAELAGAEADTLVALMLDARRRPFSSVVLVPDVTRRIVTAVSENKPDLPGIQIENRTIRHYPFGPAAAHLLGYIGEVSREEVDASDTLASGDYAGRAGVELTLEPYLAGIKGSEIVEVDALGQNVRTLSRRPPVAGARVVLTIDADLQVWAHEAFAGQKGALVAVDPSSGRILALYSCPAYDPNAFVDKTRVAERMGYFTDTRLPLYNRALQSTYSPGSTFKTITMIAGLKTGRLRASTRFGCRGMYAGMKCWKAGGHGSLDLISAYQHSCNVYFYQAGERIWIEPIHEVALALGLDQYPGFGIGPEAHGVVPTPEWERENVRGPDGEHWGTGDVRNTAIGQGYVLASPAQMAQVAGGAAMGGIGMKPAVIESIEAPDGTRILDFEPSPRANLGLDSESIELVRRAMRLVVDQGTGRRARVEGLDIGGKTGTAQNPENIDHAWFICAAPLESPRIAICVLVEHAGHHGGTVAAPIAQHVLSRYAAREGLVPRP